MQALVDFLGEDLVAHDIDEEKSVLPRLEARIDALIDAGEVTHANLDLERVRRAIRRCRRAHHRLEPAIGAHLPHFAAAAEGRIPLQRERLGELHTELGPLLEGHMALEESSIFPACRKLLSDDELAAIDREMEGRRAAR